MLAFRYAYVLALVIWLGGMIALAAIVAPAVFQTLQAQDATAGRMAAGAVFGEVLRRFHVWTYGAAAVMLVAMGGMAALGPRPGAFRYRVAIIATMFGVALFSGLWLSGRIERLQAEIGGPVSSLGQHDPRRARFDRLHSLSTTLMVLNVVGGLALLYWEAQE